MRALRERSRSECGTPGLSTSQRMHSDSGLMQSTLCRVGVTQLAVQCVEIPYGCQLVFNECLEEVSLGGHQRVRPHCHCFDVSLEGFSSAASANSWS